MKLKSLILGAVLLASTCALFTGCQTAGGGSGLSPDQIAFVSELAAYEGTSIYLSDPKHTNDRPAFVAAANSIAVLAAGTNATPSQVSAALQSLPIKQLQTTEGRYAITAATLLYDVLVRQRVDVDQNANLAAFIRGLDRGFKKALAPPPAQ